MIGWGVLKQETLLFPFLFPDEEFLAGGLALREGITKLRHRAVISTSYHVYAWEDGITGVTGGIVDDFRTLGQLLPIWFRR